MIKRRILFLMLCLLLLLTACGAQEPPAPGEAPPRRDVMVNGMIYTWRGGTDDLWLKENFEVVGTIKGTLPDDAVLTEDFQAVGLEEGLQIYAHEDYPEIIYVKPETGGPYIYQIKDPAALKQPETQSVPADPGNIIIPVPHVMVNGQIYYGNHGTDDLWLKENFQVIGAVAEVLPDDGTVTAIFQAIGVQQGAEIYAHEDYPEIIYVKPETGGPYIYKIKDPAQPKQPETPDFGGAVWNVTAADFDGLAEDGHWEYVVNGSFAGMDTLTTYIFDESGLYAGQYKFMSSLSAAETYLAAKDYLTGLYGECAAERYHSGGRVKQMLESFEDAVAQRGYVIAGWRVMEENAPNVTRTMFELELHEDETVTLNVYRAQHETEQVW